MVCKEDVLSWFKQLEGYQRVDVLYELMAMCLPFELRFLGSCIEEIGRQSYQDLRGPAINANDFDKLSKDSMLTLSLLDQSVRHRVLLSLSLLTSRNYSVANWLYKNVLRTDWLEDYIVKGNLKEENVMTELLMMFVFGVLHPAFTFEQRLYCHNIYTLLIELKETKKRSSPKPTGFGYPPGFGYPTIRTLNTSEVPPIVPVNDQQAPGLPQMPLMQPPQDIVTWGLPGFACGAPEVPPPFPLSLVNETNSPSHSRSTSPHRTVVTLRSTPMPPPAQPPRPLDTIPTPLSIDPLSSNSFQFLHLQDSVKIPEEELNPLVEQKVIVEEPWGAPVHMKEAKPPNGIRFGAVPTTKNLTRPAFIMEQFQALNLDGENTLHRSNSSSNSSLNHTPPETPSTTPSLCTVRDAGRGGGGISGEKTRVNGMPPFATTSPPPPPTPTFNNCSVPYTTYPTFTIPTRTVFPPFSTTYRPPFTPFPTYQTNDNAFSTYSVSSFMPINIQYSSQFPPRNPNCYNCGAMGHAGQDCTGQNIEDITQKTTYTIDFAPQLPDADK